MKPRTIIEKVWDAHVVSEQPGVRRDDRPGVFHQAHRPRPGNLAADHAPAAIVVAVDTTHIHAAMIPALPAIGRDLQYEQSLASVPGCVADILILSVGTVHELRVIISVMPFSIAATYRQR